MTEFEKPRKFRNRKKVHVKEEELHHPVHKPYERDTSWRRHIIVGDYSDDAINDGSDEAEQQRDTDHPGD